MRIKITSCIAFLLLAITSNLQADIEKILIKWNAALCRDVCIPNLQSKFRSVGGVTDFQINPSAGVAELHWRPRYPFSLVPFNTAMRSVGIRMLNIRVRVTGTIAHDSYNVYLVSLGDNSRFQLIGPIRPEIGQYVIRQNIANHPLSPEVLQRLLSTEAGGQTVTIEGPLFEPNRYNLILITEQINFPPPRAQDFNKDQLRIR